MVGLREVTTKKVSDTSQVKAVLEEFRYQHRALLLCRAFGLLGISARYVSHNLRGRLLFLL